MAGIIRLNEEGLTRASSDLRNRAEEFNQWIQSTQAVINSLPDSWEGAAAESFIQQFAELKPSFQKGVELTQTIAQQIDQTLQAAQELDSSIAGQYRG
ncbi:MAG: WXG100 family type VII secretion target [Erysipelotrichaceae bacterium]